MRIGTLERETREQDSPQRAPPCRKRRLLFQTLHRRFFCHRYIKRVYGLSQRDVPQARHALVPTTGAEA